MNKLTLPAKLAALERANSCLVAPMAEVGELARALEEREKALLELMNGWEHSHKAGWRHNAHCCVNDLLVGLRRILEAR